MQRTSAARAARRPLAGGLAIGLALVATGCGQRSDASSVAVGAPTNPGVAVAAGMSNGGLPVLPPIAERRPESFDAQGCLESGPDVPAAAGPAPACTPAVALDVAEAGAATDDWRNLAGFSGPLFTTDLRAGAPVVLVASVTSATDGPWQAIGLARNESAATLDGIGVTAELLAADGTLLETVTALASVGSVRAGEPVPFALVAATAESGAVASVRWAASAAPPEPDHAAGARAYELRTYWTRPVGGDPMESDLHHDGGAATTHLVFGSVGNVGVDGGGVTVHAAWVDASGRVVALASADARTPDGPPAASLAAGAESDYLLEVGGAVAPGLAQLTPMLWAVER